MVNDMFCHSLNTIFRSAYKNERTEGIKVLELDIRFGEDFITMRIELFKDTTREDFFRCKVWEQELFRLRPSFPQDDNGQPEHITDDSIMVERPIPRRQVDYKGFNAENQEAALQIVIEDLMSFIEDITGERPVQV